MILASLFGESKANENRTTENPLNQYVKTLVQSFIIQSGVELDNVLVLKQTKQVAGNN